MYVPRIKRIKYKGSLGVESMSRKGVIYKGHGVKQSIETNKEYNN